MINNLTLIMTSYCVPIYIRLCSCYTKLNLLSKGCTKLGPLMSCALTIDVHQKYHRHRSGTLSQTRMEPMPIEGHPQGRKSFTTFAANMPNIYVSFSKTSVRICRSPFDMTQSDCPTKAHKSPNPKPSILNP